MKAKIMSCLKNVNFSKFLGAAQLFIRFIRVTKKIGLTVKFGSVYLVLSLNFNFSDSSSIMKLVNCISNAQSISRYIFV